MLGASGSIGTAIGRRAAIVFVALISLFWVAAAQAASPGSLDASFGSGGLANTGANTQLLGAAAQSDGKVVATGSDGSSLIVTRFNGSGGVDFKTAGPATGAPVPGSIGHAVAVQSDGKIVVVGSAGSTGGVGMVVERFNANGTPDSSFGHAGAVDLLTSDLAEGYSVAIQPDGKILAGGAADAQGSSGFEPRVLVARLNSNGTPDASFGSGGTSIIDVGPISAARGLAVQSDGKIVVAGGVQIGLQVPEAMVARLTSSGALDHSFAGSGFFEHQYSKAGANSVFNAVALQSDGKIVAGGAAVDGTTGADALFVRFTSSGGQDGSFGSGGAAYSPSANNSPPGSSGVPGVNGLVIAGSGDIVGAGYAAIGPYSSGALWALNSSGHLDAAFGTGGGVLTNAGGSKFNQFFGLAIVPSGNLVAVGDTQQAFMGGTTGIAARYIGLGAAPPPPGGGLKASLTGLKSKYKTSSVSKSGFKVGVTCNQACSFKLSLVISAGTAKKLKIKTKFKQCKKVHGKKKCKTVSGYKSVSIASGRGSRGSSGTSTLTLKFAGKYLKALKNKSFGATLNVSVTSTSTHKSKTLHKGLSFTH